LPYFLLWYLSFTYSLKEYFGLLVKDITDISLSATSYDDLESKSTKSSTIHKSPISTTLQLPSSILPLPTFKQETLSKDRDKAAPEG
jgi:hypothetical protein